MTCQSPPSRGVRIKGVRSSGDLRWYSWPVKIGGRVCGERGPIPVPLSAQAVDPQREHMFRVLDEPPGAGKLQALLRDVAMCAFDFSRTDRQPLGEGLAIFQLVFASVQIPIGRPEPGPVRHSGRGPRGGEPGLSEPRRRGLFSARPFASPSRLSPRRRPARWSSPPRSNTRKHGRNRSGSYLVRRTALRSAPQSTACPCGGGGRAVAHRVQARIRPEARPDRTGEQPPSGFLHAAFYAAPVDRRAASLGVRFDHGPLRIDGVACQQFSFCHSGGFRRPCWV